jgi:hypothetical protein
MGNDGETTSNERSKVQGKGAPRKCATDHSIASRRQQAHIRKRVPTALPRTYGGFNQLTGQLPGKALSENLVECVLIVTRHGSLTG